jgi:electron transfer flavoprotein alpha subunit
MMGPIWVCSDVPKVARELSAAAGALSRSLSTTSVLIDLDQTNQSVKALDKRLLLKGDRKITGSPELTAEALARGARKFKPSIVLLGATREGRETASMLAVKLRQGCLSEVLGLRVEGDVLISERNVYAGRAVAEVSSGLPCIATVKLGVYPPIEGTVQKGDVEDVGVLAQRVIKTKSVLKQAEKVDLHNAKIIVSAGRGFKKKEDLQLVTQLADAVGGAVGCSRPLSSDYGWLPEEHHIGLTGVTVHPSLYLALGISGQLQHLAGIRESRIIAAVNTDREAPIFQAADYGVVGDLYQVVPALLRLLQPRAA